MAFFYSIDSITTTESPKGGHQKQTYCILQLFITWNGVCTLKEDAKLSTIFEQGYRIYIFLMTSTLRAFSAEGPGIEIRLVWLKKSLYMYSVVSGLGTWFEEFGTISGIKEERKWAHLSYAEPKLEWISTNHLLFTLPTFRHCIYKTIFRISILAGISKEEWI